MRLSSFVGWVLVAVAAAPGVAVAQRAAIIVRHAENAGDTLTATGREQAQRLATALAGADVRAIYSTDSRRTIATATPLADMRRLEVQLYDTSAGPGRFDARPFVARVRKAHPDDVVVVVGHVTTIPDLLRAFGCPGNVTVPPLDYDDLYIVVPRGAQPSALVRVKY